MISGAVPSLHLAAGVARPVVWPTPGPGAVRTRRRPGGRSSRRVPPTGLVDHREMARVITHGLQRSLARRFGVPLPRGASHPRTARENDTTSAGGAWSRLSETMMDLHGKTTMWAVSTSAVHNRSWLAVVWCLCVVATAAQAQTREALAIRGHPQTLRLYGARGAFPVIVSSGDGGWIHLGPHVADVLASRGYFVVGFDVKAYLSSFTSGRTTLRTEDEPGDYRVLADFAARGATQRPVLVGVSEGAGLSVLAATDPQTRSAISGVVGLGLPDINELGWRWRDALIYLTHGVPDEPTFRAATIIARVAPAPLAAIHSTGDEFVALAEVQRLFAVAREPKRLWVIDASDHRFSNNLAEFDRRLLEAVAWVREHAVGP